MIVKFSIFLCALCVVEAYVAVNIFDDDVETQRSLLSVGMEGSPKISDCSLLSCVRLCRRLGHKGGVCVHGKCICDWPKELEDVDETQRSSLSDEMEGSPKISDCSPLGCVQLCRHLGLKGGVCINGKCKCDWHKELEVGTERSSEISDCSPLGCVQLCRRLGLKGGVCVHGKCKCDLFVELEDADSQTTPLIEMEKSPMILECSPLGCAQLCRRIGLKGGVCVHGICKCDLFIELEDADSHTTPLIEMEKSPMISECSPLGCAQLCRRIGLKGGVCVHGICKCDLFIELEGDAPRSLTICDWSSCDRGCRSIGYPGGSCIGSECRCNPRPFKFEDSNRIDSTDSDVRVMELEKSEPIISDCNPLFCEQQCRRIFHKGGVCVHGQCKCDIIIDFEENNEIPATEEKNKLNKDFMTDIKKKPSIGICNIYDCTNMCRRIGFIGGRCDTINNSCQCF